MEISLIEKIRQRGGNLSEVIQSTFITKRGRKLNLKISGWNQLLMRGTFAYKMHKHPLTLLSYVNLWTARKLATVAFLRAEIEEILSLTFQS